MPSARWPKSRIMAGVAMGDMKVEKMPIFIGRSSLAICGTVPVGRGNGNRGISAGRMLRHNGGDQG